MDKKVRLIDANVLKHKIIGDPDIYPGKTFQHTILQIDNAPTIDAEPVRHGKWIGDAYNGFGFVCSKCNAPMSVRTNYCHRCGARMDGGKNDEKV